MRGEERKNKYGSEVLSCCLFFFFQAEDGIRDTSVTGVQTCALPISQLKRVERGFENLLFNSRWLMAPFYFGLVVSLAVLLFKFCAVLWEFIVHAPGSKESDIILGALALIDLSLTGNLILIVVFSGYENFVSKIDPAGHPDWPEWMTRVNFGGLK